MAAGVGRGHRLRVEGRPGEHPAGVGRGAVARTRAERGEAAEHRHHAAGRGGLTARTRADRRLEPELAEQPGLALADGPAAVAEDGRVGRRAAADLDPDRARVGTGSLAEGDLVAAREIEQRGLEGDSRGSAADDGRRGRGHLRGWRGLQDRGVVAVVRVTPVAEPGERRPSGDDREGREPDHDLHRPSPDRRRRRVGPSDRPSLARRPEPGGTRAAE